MRIDAISFVDAWMDAYHAGENQSDIALKLGCTSANVSTRAKKLRDNGVELPELVNNRGGNKLDIESLNARLQQRMNEI